MYSKNFKKFEIFFKNWTKTGYKILPFFIFINDWIYEWMKEGEIKKGRGSKKRRKDQVLQVPVWKLHEDIHAEKAEAL